MKTCLYYSTVASATDVRPKRVKSTWANLVKRLKRPEVRGEYNLKEYLALPRREKAKQKGGAGWIPATFKKEGERNDRAIDKLYLFVGDVDNTKGQPITFESLRAALAGTEAVIHTTYSHSRERPKFRFIVPLARPISSAKHIDVFNYFNTKLGGGLDPKGKTPSQLYYWPSFPRDARRLFTFEHLRGEILNPDALPDAPSITRDQTDARPIDLPANLPEVDIKKLELSNRIKELILTGKDRSNRYTSRSEMVFAVAIALISRGCTDAQIASICLDERYGISEKVLEQKHPRKYIIGTLRKARSMKYAGDVNTIDEIVAELNTRHAVVGVGGRTLIMTESRDPVLGRHMIELGFERDLRLHYGNRRIVVNEKSMNIADVWVSHEARRQYDRIVFSPERDIPGCYNLWRGFAVKPKKGSCQLFLQHVRDNIASGDPEVYKYIIAFMADAVQHPARLPGVTLVMRGGEGVGKGVFATEFGALFGQHFVHVSNSHHLVGKFNAHLKDALLVFADEAFYAGDKASQGVLNAMITEAVRAIEYKGKDVVTVPNFVRLIMASNHDWVVPAGPNARRFFVVDVSNANQQNIGYFTAIRREMAKGGREALLQYLLDFDLSGIELRAFPRTAALVDQQIRSMGAEHKFWLERLRRGELTINAGQWTGLVKCSTLYEQFIHSAQKAGFSRRSGEVEFGLALRNLCPEMRRGRRRTVENYDLRAYYYIFPDLKRCRELFERQTKMAIDWSI